MQFYFKSIPIYSFQETWTKIPMNPHGCTNNLIGFIIIQITPTTHIIIS